MKTENKPITNDILEEEKDAKLEQLGEMSLREGVKYIWNLLLELKLKYIAIGIFFCISLVIMGFIIYYVVPVVFKILDKIFDTSLSMVTGTHDISYQYSFFDCDLLFTIPLCIVIAVLVFFSFRRRSFIFASIYFVILISVLEIWDYYYNTMITIPWYYGGFCFLVMFIIIPILLVKRKCLLRGK